MLFNPFYRHCQQISSRRKFSLSKLGVTHVQWEEYTGIFPAVKLRGLSGKTTLDDVFSFLSRVLVHQPVDIVCEYDKGRTTGTVGILLACEQDAKDVLQLHKKRIGARYIEVFRMRRSEYHQLVHEQVKTTKPMIHSRPRFTDAEAVIKVTGLSYETVVDDVVRLFQKYSVKHRDVVIAANRQGYAAGIAYIRFDDIKIALDAQTVLNSTEIGGRRLTVGLLESHGEAEQAMSLY